MTQLDNIALQNRVRQLELKLSRIHKAILIGSLGLLATLILGATLNEPNPSDDVIKASRFVLVDKTGFERAVLGFRDESAGLFVFGRGVKSDPKLLLYAGVEEIKGLANMEAARIEVRNDITPKVNAAMSANDIGLFDEEEAMGITMHYINSPALQFVDRSGMSFASLSHDSRNGTAFEIRQPLGIKDAFNEGIKAYAQGKDADQRVEEAYSKSLRIDLGAKPFSDAHLRLWKDGRVIWSAK